METKNKLNRNIYLSRTLLLTSLVVFAVFIAACNVMGEAEEKTNLEGSNGLAEKDNEMLNQNPTQSNSMSDINVDGALLCSPLGGSPEEQAAAGAKGLELSPGGGESICTWTCDDQALFFAYVGNTWVNTGGADGSGSDAGPSGFDWGNTQFDNMVDWVQVGVDAGFPTCGNWVVGSLSDSE